MAYRRKSHSRSTNPYSYKSEYGQYKSQPKLTQKEKEQIERIRRLKKYGARYNKLYK